MNTTKSETSAHPLAVTIEVDGETWQWFEVRAGVVWAAAVTGEELDAVFGAQRKIWDASSKRKSVLMNGRRVRVVEIGSPFIGGGGVEFSFRWVEVTPIGPPAAPTFRINVALNAPTRTLDEAAELIRKLPEVTPEAVERVQQEARRRAREAPLVALVAAVPEGLDANGWRAAVLAVHEEVVQRDARTRAVQGRPCGENLLTAWRVSGVEGALRWCHECGTWNDLKARTATGENYVQRIARDAYRRAVAPQGQRPKVERKIGGRAVRLVVDNGEG